MRSSGGEAGYSLIELIISLFIISMVSVMFIGLLMTLLNSAALAEQKSVANSLVNNQMEYLRSLSYDSLAVSGGSILSSSYIPAKTTQTVGKLKYSIFTDIRYADDAFDGCGTYPSPDLKKLYCRNFSAPGNSSGNNLVNDTNPADYKMARVTVKNASGQTLAVLDTQIAARVAETASTTGALFTTVTDPSGTPISEATVTVKNTALSPNVTVSSSTDANGVAIFYGLPPDSQQRYTISADKSGYSSITSISPSGSLQPTYASQKILSQQSSYLTLVLGKMSPNSLIIATEDTSGNPLANIKVYVKGGYKKYTDTTNTAYYFDAMAPTDTRPVTDATGMTGVTSLPPVNEYIFCDNNGDTGCASTSGTKYYLAAAVPYGGSGSLAPISIPQNGDTSSPTYLYNGNLYSQKVKLMLTTSSSFPRVRTMDPDSINTTDNLSNVKVVFGGSNLSGATAQLSQGGTTYSPKNCSGTSTQLTCSYTLTTATTGALQVTLQGSGGALTLPTDPLGGIYVK